MVQCFVILSEGEEFSNPFVLTFFTFMRLLILALKNAFFPLKIAKMYVRIENFAKFKKKKEKKIVEMSGKV